MKSENVDFVINIIDYSINRKCIKCSSLLGIYAGEILNKYRKIE